MCSSCCDEREGEMKRGTKNQAPKARSRSHGHRNRTGSLLRSQTRTQSSTIWTNQTLFGRSLGPFLRFGILLAVLILFFNLYTAYQNLLHSSSTMSDNKTESPPTFREIMDKASKSAFRGGLAGGAAMAANVACLMWMRTTVCDDDVGSPLKMTPSWS